MRKLFALLLCCLLLTGCGSKASGLTATTAPSRPPVATRPGPVTETLAPEPPVTETAAPETAAPEIAEPVHVLTLYAPNEDATGFIYASWELEEITPDAICVALIEAGVLKEDVEFLSLTVEKGQISLDVNEAFLTQLCAYGTAGERMMVGSVVNTLLGAYDAKSVFLTCQGQILESGHIIYDFPLTFYEND